MLKGKANVIIDGQWGSTGKGKLAGYLALKHDIAVATCDFMSNAGHTFVNDHGRKIVTCQLPTALVNDDAMLFINPGAAITLSRLFQEIEENSGVSKRLIIHPHAAVIDQIDREIEETTLGRISSTLKGCGGCLSRKVMRVATLAKDVPELSSFIGDTTELTHTVLQSGGTVLVEGAQGFDLSLNHGYEYPFVTSRDVTTMSILNNAGIPPRYLGDVYGSLRTFPIRVGNTYDENGNETGNSGPYYDDQIELTWEEISKLSGSSVALSPERTTVTNKIRRVFTFSYRQAERFINVCEPTKLFINFVNYIDSEDYGKRTMSEMSIKTRIWLSSLVDQLKLHNSDRTFYCPKLSLLGTGPQNKHMVEVN